MTDLLVRALDPRDDADMDVFQDVYVAAERAEDPDAPLYSREDGVAMLSATDGGSFYEGYGAFDGDMMVGESMVTGSRVDNLDTARIWVWVPPSSSRRGVGTRLVEHAEERALALGRRVAHAQARIGADGRHGSRLFAEHLGYSLANTEVERRLALPVDDDLLARLTAVAASHHAAYEIRAVVGAVPEDLRASYAALKNLLYTEAPQGDLEVEVGRETADEITAQDRALAASGRTRVVAYALDQGAVVGFAAAEVTSDDFDHVDQRGTIVHPVHRGHRLGMAVKCAQLRAVQEAFPDKRYVQTTNAETNAPMVAVNEALGFRVHQVRGDFHKRLYVPSG